MASQHDGMDSGTSASHEALQLEESAEDLYEAAPCGYFSMREDGMIVKVNQTFLTWTGYGREDLVGVKRIHDLLPAGDRIYYETHYVPLLQMQGMVREVAIEILCADGRRLPVLVNSALKRHADETPSVIRTIVFDATDRRGYERELLSAREQLAEQNDRLRELDRLKDEFVAVISHDLRAPLTAIIGYVESLLRREEAFEERDARALRVIERHSHRLARLLDDLLLIAEFTAGTLSLQLEAVELGPLVSEAIELAQPLADAGRIELAVDKAEVAPLLADRAGVARLLDNLISNAIKFTGEGGRVTVRLRASPQGARFEVEDTGIGISRADRELIFSGFFRARSAIEHGVPGAGLGLAIVKAVVEAHGGQVTLASEEGAGSCFSVELPAG